MLVFKTSTAVESKLFPGVTLTVKKMTEDRRDALRLALAVPLAKLQLRGEELRDLAGRKDTQSEARRQEIVNECSVIENADLVAIKIAWGLKAISGLAIDSEENIATVEEWKKWPSDLVAEAVQMIDEASGLSTAQRKNLSEPTTPGDQTLEATSASIALPANASDSINPEIAEPSSQQM